MQYGRIRPVEELTRKIDAVYEGAIAAVIEEVIVVKSFGLGGRQAFG
jgi:D-aminopeptidase